MDIRYLLGDARELIKEVPDHSIATVYFDPPFNTGNDFRLNTEKDAIGFSDVFSSDNEYANLVEPILEDASRVLKPDGSLFFHISAEEMLIPYVLCQKHFEKVQPIFWNRCRSKNNVKNKLGAVTDIIFWCSGKKPKYNLVYQPLDAYYAENSYKNKDSRGNYALGHLTYTATQKTGRNDRYYKMSIEGVDYTAPFGWRVSREGLEDLIAEDRVHIPSKNGSKLYRKIYKHESKGKPATNLWDDIHSIAMGDQERKYPTQKPVKLVERIIEMTTDPGDIVLDPMAGAGTTGVAARNLGRKALLFEKNPDAISIMANKFNNKTSTV
jgi:site-specific DNA-methyltransferase (adenine-specific)